MADIKTIDLIPGQPLDRGRAYGEQARDLIRRIKETYAATFGYFTGKTWEQLRERGREFLTPAEKFAPDLIREIEGIAQGAGLEFLDVFLLNARSEIMFGAQAQAQSKDRVQAAPDECTALLALGPATAGQGVYLAQNWDWLTGVRDCQVLLRYPGEKGRAAFVSFTEAGQVAKLGLNSAGLGLTVNNLNTDQPRVGVPWILICRKVLESDSLTQAMGTILSTPRAHSINYLLARSEGEEAEGVCLETAPTEPHVLWPREGLLAHTNHFLEPLETARDMKLWDHQYPCSFNRYIRAREGLRKRSGSLDPDGIRAVLSDHFDRPHSICMHRNPDSDPAWTTVTNLSVIMDLPARAVEYCLGNPCQGEWERIDLSGFLAVGRQ